MIREVHGVANVLRVNRVTEREADVLIADGNEAIYLHMRPSTDCVRLTVADARFLARELVASAQRVEDAGNTADAA